MADTKISQLPAATTPLSGAEVVPVVQSGATVQTPVNEISKLVTETANTFTAANTFSAVQTFTASPIISVTDNTNAALRVTQLGTGYALLVEDSTNPDSTPFVVDALGQVGIGTTTALGTYGKLRVGGTGYQALNVGSDDASGVNTIVAANAASEARIGTVTNHPVDLYTNNLARARLDTSGNFLITGPGGLGYGTGSGGTVTQLTNKSTGVTINKTNGQIVTASGTIVAGTPTSFLVTNSTVAATDVVIVHRSSGGSNVSYTIGCDLVSAGSFRVYIDNISAAGLNEVLTLNFAVIKAVTS